MMIQDHDWRPCVYWAGMKSHEVLHEVVVVSGKVKMLAADVNLSLAMIYRWAKAVPEKGKRGGGIPNPLDHLEPLLCQSQESQGRHIVQQICERAGGRFIKNPAAKSLHAESAIGANGRIYHEFGNLLGIIIRAADDNAISVEEARTIRARWDDLISLTEGFVWCCEQGDFSPMEKDVEEKRTLNVIAKVSRPRSSTVRKVNADVTASSFASVMDRIEKIFSCTQDRRVVQWICGKAGGFFIGSSKDKWPHPNSPVAAYSRIIQQFGALLGIIGEAMVDNVISLEEAPDIRARWEELKCVTEGFVHYCEQGNFCQLRGSLSRQIPEQAPASSLD